MSAAIIDFHTHPYINDANNCCNYKSSHPMDPDRFLARHLEQGIGTICGTVIGQVTDWEDIVHLNDQALILKERWKDHYVPGFHIHPGYAEESITEITRMATLDVRLIGELVPYMHGWDMTHPGLIQILEAAQEHNMVVSYHSTGISQNVMEHLLCSFPGINFVAAHPGDRKQMELHLAVMKKYSNYYLDLSGTGLGRMGILRYGINKAGKERFLFGTDSPICQPEMYIAAIKNDPMLTDEEKRAVLWKNAQKLLFGE